MNKGVHPDYRTVRLGELPSAKMPSAFSTAKLPGGKHHGWYLQQLDKPAEEIESGIKSFGVQIARHQGWIADPLTKMSDFYALDVRRQSALVVGWKQDILRHLDCIEILRGVLKERKT